MPDFMICVEEIHKSFGDLHVLNGVELNVTKGEVICIIGPSGSGKSTLLRCLNLLEIPDSGKIWIDGVELTKKGENVAKIRQQVGMVFQAFNLFPHMSVIENVMEGPRTVLGWSKDKAFEVARKQLSQVGLAEKLDSKPFICIAKNVVKSI